MATATDEADDLNLPLLASQWIQEVSEHRTAQKVYGKVSASVIDTPGGSEIHLTEETTFKAARGQPCPYAQATNWLSVRMAERRKAGDTGGGRIEFEQKGGDVTWAKVVETTVICPASLDSSRKGK